MKAFLKRLEHAAKDEEIVISQRDGTVKRFPQAASREAFINVMDRLGAGEHAPAEHPMVEAVRSSDDPAWSGSFFASIPDTDEWTASVPDLSEP